MPMLNSPDLIHATPAGSAPAVLGAQALTARRDAALGTTSNPARTGEHVQRAAARRINGLFGSSDAAPVLSPFALHGLAGDIVEATAPITEATPAAMLVTLLTTFGAMVGRGAYVAVGAERHHASLFVLVVGPTGQGRKGTSLKAITPPLRAAGPDAQEFLARRKVSGLASGEGLVAALSGGADLKALDMWEGAGHVDHRALVIEEEFAGLLTSAQRQGSKLSATVRELWDGNDLRVMTKNDPLHLPEPHAGVIGHVTPEELKERLTSTDVSNGFANRFLVVYTRRTELIPEPTTLPERMTSHFGARLQAALDRARDIGAVSRSAAFRQLWARWYGVLESGPTGGRLFDSLSERKSPYVLRLALVYALLDGQSEVDAVHLRAALAVWQYSEASIAHVWGVNLGDAKLDKLWTAVRAAGPQGLTRDAMHTLFSKNGSSEDYDRYEAALVGRGLARVETRRTGGRGRPPQVLVRAD